MTKLIDKPIEDWTDADVDAAMNTLAAENPDVVNPWSDLLDSCAYFMETNEEGVNCRCLVGEMIHRQGWATNSELFEMSHNAEEVLNALGMGDIAAQRAHEWQLQADGRCPSERMSWSVAVMLMESDD